MSFFDSSGMSELATLLLGFLLNLAIAVLIVRGIFNGEKHGKNSIFTFIAFNTVIYFVMTFLADTELSVGWALASLPSSRSYAIAPALFPRGR